MNKEQRDAIIDKLGYIEWSKPLVAVSHSPDHAHFFSVWDRFKVEEKRYFSRSFESLSDEELTARVLSGSDKDE